MLLGGKHKSSQRDMARSVHGTLCLCIIKRYFNHNSKKMKGTVIHYPYTRVFVALHNAEATVLDLFCIFVALCILFGQRN